MKVIKTFLNFYKNTKNNFLEPITEEVIEKLFLANSIYYQTFKDIKTEVEEELKKSKMILTTLQTVTTWLEDFHLYTYVDEMLKSKMNYLLKIE